MMKIKKRSISDSDPGVLYFFPIFFFFCLFKGRALDMFYPDRKDTIESERLPTGGGLLCESEESTNYKLNC